MQVNVHAHKAHNSCLPFYFHALKRLFEAVAGFGQSSRCDDRAWQRHQRQRGNDQQLHHRQEALAEGEKRIGNEWKEIVI